MLRPPRADQVTDEPGEPQQAVGEEPSHPDGAVQWPPGLVMNLEWAAVWAVD